MYWSLQLVVRHVSHASDCKAHMNPPSAPPTPAVPDDDPLAPPVPADPLEEPPVPAAPAVVPVLDVLLQAAENMRPILRATGIQANRMRMRKTPPEMEARG
jgi:hypothetical protein